MNANHFWLYASIEELIDMELTPEKESEDSTDDRANNDPLRNDSSKSSTKHTGQVCEYHHQGSRLI